MCVRAILADSVLSAAHSLLAVCGAVALGGVTMLRAAAADAGDPDLSHLVGLVGDCNIPTATNCLLLVGYVIASTPAAERPALLAALRARGLDASIAAQEEIRDAGFARARSQFQAVCEVQSALPATVHRSGANHEPLHVGKPTGGGAELVGSVDAALMSEHAAVIESAAAATVAAAALAPPVAFGVPRAQCEVPGCPCAMYALVDGSIGGPCRHCGEWASCTCAAYGFFDISRVCVCACVCLMCQATSLLATATRARRRPPWRQCRCLWRRRPLTYSRPSRICAGLRAHRTAAVLS